jgi:hypothetical protein
MKQHEIDTFQNAIKLLAAGDWDAAHMIVQSSDHPMACRIHALLHRVEGDYGNAAYWYRRAGVDVPTVTTDEERRQIEAELTT